MKSQADGLTIPVYDLPDGIYSAYPRQMPIKSRFVKGWFTFRTSEDINLKVKRTKLLIASEIQYRYVLH